MLKFGAYYIRDLTVVDHKIDFTMFSFTFNSLALGKFEWNFGYVIFKRILVIDGWGICMSLDVTDDQSTLVQVMAWCCQATSHYLSECWPRSLSPYGVTRSQCVKVTYGNIRQPNVKQGYNIWIFIHSLVHSFIHSFIHSFEVRTHSSDEALNKLLLLDPKLLCGSQKWYSAYLMLCINRNLFD